MAAQASSPTTSAKRWTTCCSPAASSTSRCWAGRGKWWADEPGLRRRIRVVPFGDRGRPLVQVIEFQAIQIEKREKRSQRGRTMLAEKFFLVLETLKSHASSDGSPRVVSTAPHVPIQLPRRT